MNVLNGFDVRGGELLLNERPSLIEHVLGNQQGTDSLTPSVLYYIYISACRLTITPASQETT